MKKISILVLFCLSFLFLSSTKTSSSLPIVTHINSKWNQKNSLDVKYLKNCTVKIGYIEDQSIEVQNRFTKIPFIVVYKDNTIIKVWEGDIMFKPTTTLKEIQKVVDSLN